MRLFKLCLLGIFIAAFWSCSDLGDPYVEAECPDGQVKDCAGVCGGTAVLDECDVCSGDGLTCNVDYSTQIQPIFAINCIGCHGGSGGLYLNSYTNLMAGGNSGAVVISGNGAGSLLVKKLRDEHAPSMPYGNCCIESSLIDLIETWIDEGAQNN